MSDVALKSRVENKDVYSILKKRIRSMKPDSKLSSERKLSSELLLSRSTVHKALSILTAEGYVYRKHGDGTYINPHRPALKKRIFLLLPCPGFLTMLHPSALTVRQILQGMYDEAFGAGISVETIPVSRDNNPDNVDWKAIESIPRHGNVFVMGAWYRKLFGFFRERECNIIYCTSSQYDKDADIFPYHYYLVYDHEGANELAVKTLLTQGRKHPALVDFFIDVTRDCDASYRNGYSRGIEKYGYPSTKKSVIKFNYAPGNITEALEDLTDKLVHEWTRMKYDSLLVPWDNCIPAVLKAVERLKLRIPEDIAVICTRDYQEIHKTSPSVSGYSIPGFTIGQETVRIFSQDEFNNKGRTIVKHEWIERESTGGGKPVSRNIPVIYEHIYLT